MKIVRKGTKEYEELMMRREKKQYQRDEMLIQEFLEFRKNPDGRKDVIIDLCNKIRKHTNMIEEAIRKEKQDLEQQKKSTTTN